MPLPRARSEHLVVQELPEETLVFDCVRNKAHCLDRLTAFVWRRCDGHTDLARLARELEGELAAPLARTAVQFTLEQLGRRHLLEGWVDQPTVGNRKSRRELLKQLSAAAMLPVILTVAAPRAGAAASVACTSLPDFFSCGKNMLCCQGKCITPTGGVGFKCTVDCQCGPGLNCFNGACSLPS